MTWICYVGIELSARTQYFLLAMEIFTLALFSIVALAAVYIGSPPDHSVFIHADWFNPFDDPWRLDRAGRGRSAGGVHLLGLGQRRLRERGVREPRHRAPARRR